MGLNLKLNERGSEKLEILYWSYLVNERTRTTLLLAPLTSYIE